MRCLLLAGAASLLVLSCGKTLEEEKPSDIPVESVSLSKTELSLVEGGSETLTATVKPDNATDKTVTWSSSDATVVSVDQKGKVTALKGGTATITAVAGDKSATAFVDVLEMTPSSVEIEGKGGAFDIKIIAERGVHLSSKPDWVREVSVEKQVYHFEVLTNDSDQVRSGVVSFCDDEGVCLACVVKQEGYLLLDVNVDKLNFDMHGGSEEIKVTSTMNWTVSCSESWCVPSATGGSGNGGFTLSVGELSAEGTRTAVVTLKAGSLTRTIAVSQVDVDWNKEFYHRSLFMRFTATWCPLCPLMYETVQRAQTDYPDKIVHVAIHGHGSDLYLPAFSSLIYQYNVSGYPTGYVDGRVRVANQEVDIAAPKVVAAVKETESLYGTKTGIAINSSCSGREVSIQLTAYSKKADNYKLTLILLEDGILGSQAGAEGGIFTHKDVARIPVTALEGDNFSISEDNSYKSFSFQTSIPDGYNIDRMKILAYIQAPQDGGYVDNCLVAPLGKRISVQQSGSTSGGGTEGIVPGEDIHYR